MRPFPARRFSIADGMILVAASAIGMMIARACLPGFSRTIGYTGVWRLKLIFSWAVGLPSCLVIPWMAALIVLRLRKPRPGLRRLARQPGFVACVVAMASLVPGLLWFGAIHHRPGFQDSDGYHQAWLIVTHWTTPAVVGAWLAMILARRWRPEPSWIDRLGRLLGLFWIAIYLGVYLVFHWLDRIVALLP